MSNFKKALKTTVLFIVIVILLSMGIMEAFFAGENFYYQDANERAELSGTLDFLICGSSHTLRALEPSILDDELGVDSYNVSIPNSNMQQRYEMIKVEMERNPVDTVILGVSYNTMTRDRSVRGYEGDYYVLSKLNLWDRIPYFFSSIQPSEYISIYYQFLNRGFECMDMAAHGTWVDHNEKTEKGYVPYDNQHYVERDDEMLAPNPLSVYNTETLTEEIYEPNVTYLDKILDLCNENNVTLIMISEPLSKTAISRYQNLDASREWYAEYAQNNDICYFDFGLYKEYDDLFTDMVDYHDAFHLNNTGADKFSELFCSFYQEIENGEDVEDLFYDSYDEMKSIVFEN